MNFRLVLVGCQPQAAPVAVVIPDLRNIDLRLSRLMRIRKGTAVRHFFAFRFSGVLGYLTFPHRIGNYAAICLFRQIAVRHGIGVITVVRYRWLYILHFRRHSLRGNDCVKVYLGFILFGSQPEAFKIIIVVPFLCNADGDPAVPVNLRFGFHPVEYVAVIRERNGNNSAHYRQFFPVDHYRLVHMIKVDPFRQIDKLQRSL